MSFTKGISYSVEYFIRKFCFHLLYTWNIGSEQREKKMLTLYIAYFLRNTLIFFTYLSDLSLLISHQME